MKKFDKLDTELFTESGAHSRTSAPCAVTAFSAPQPRAITHAAATRTHRALSTALTFVALCALVAFAACKHPTDNSSGGGGNEPSIIPPTATRVKDASDNDTEWVQLSSGTFRMGSNDTENVHAVWLSSFLICDHEVTQKEYETYCRYSSTAPSASYGDGDTFPAYYVSWYDAIVYCNLRSVKDGLEPCYRLNGETDVTKWSDIQGTSGKYCGPASSNPTWNTGITCDFTKNGYRLPTEAEWECAARGGITDTGDVWAGTTDSAELGEYAWYSANSGSKTHEVKKKTANGYGLYDMSGNVWEWCWDWFADAYPSDANNPQGAASGSDRILRGGSWYNSANRLSVSNRITGENSPHHHDRNVGFRVVRTVAE